MLSEIDACNEYAILGSEHGLSLLRQAALLDEYSKRLTRHAFYLNRLVVSMLLRVAADAANAALQLLDDTGMSGQLPAIQVVVDIVQMLVLAAVFVATEVRRRLVYDV